MKSRSFALGLALLTAACTSTTSGIEMVVAESSVRQFCPAFKKGDFAQDSARTYGSEQITTYRNQSKFNCRCVSREINSTPRCKQVVRFVLGNIE
jgi:hypothetical protein